MQSTAAKARELSTDAAIRTARLSLVPPSVEHAPALYTLLNDWDVVRNLSEVPWPLRYEDVANFLASMPSVSTDDFVVLAPAPIDSHSDHLILRGISDTVGNASTEDREGTACFEAPLRGTPQHQGRGVKLVPIGVVAVKKPGSGEPPRKMPRLGYWIGKRYWGSGYGTEAIGALVDYAFRTFSNELVGAGIFHDNPASRRVLEKLGFSAVGAKTAKSRSRGVEVETIDVQITRSAWDARAVGP